MALLHLIYVSTARGDLSVEALDKILESSLRHNKPQHVTGMLLFANGSFMQVLEGEEADVDETFSRIEQDPRHQGIFVLERARIAARNFDRWTMGFRRLDAADAETYPGYAPLFENGFDASAIGVQTGLALEMLLSFARNQQGSASGGRG